MPAIASLASIDDQRLLRLAQDLVRIPSPSRLSKEGPVAEYLASYLSAAELQVALQEVEPGRPNVIATLAGSGPGPRIILNGHTDVVPPGDEAHWDLPPYSGAVRDGKLYGRGAADMKGPLAALIEGVLAFAESRVPFRGEILLTLVVGEEDGQTGTRHLVEVCGVRGDWGIVAEPTELRPVTCHKGLVTMEVTTWGRSCHASRSEEGVNAIEHMRQALGALQQLDVRLRQRTHPLLGSPSLTPTVIQGGIFPNVVPDRCTLTLDRRLLPGEDCASAVQEVNEALAAVAAADPDFRYQVRAPDCEPPMEIPGDSPVVTALRRATEQVLGHDPGTHGWSATCDANILTNGGTPTVIFGPGSIAQAHQPNEYVEISQLTHAAKIYKIALHDLLGG